MPEAKNKNLLIFVFSLQIAFLGLITLNWIGLELPFIRQIITFVYLTFVPGILLLGLFRINNHGTTEIILYSVGLSLSFLMFIGFLVNTFYPIFGITKPLSEIPLIFTISIIVISLCAVLFFGKEEFKIPIPGRKDATSPIVLLLALLPFISIFGAYILNYHNNNTILLVMLAIISTIPLFVSSNKFPNKILPFVIWAISISLLFSVTLSGKYVVGGDSQIEYYYANLVQMKGFWDSSIPGTVNALLRIVMLHPVYSTLLSIELADAFKVVHPLLYSFTPLALYVAFKRQTGEKMAFLSVLFFMFMHAFYTKLSLNTRTGIAELFLALFILVITDKNMEGAKKYILSLIFALSIVVTHYGTSYVFMFALISATSLLIFIRKYRSQSPGQSQSPYSSMKKNVENISFTLLYIGFTFAWYVYNASASCFRLFVRFFDHMIAQMSEVFTPETSYTVYTLSKDWVFSVGISLDLLLIANIFIIIGITSLTWNIVKRKRVEFQEEFVVLSMSFFGVLLATFLPTRGVSIVRAVHLSLCFLAPFAVIGFMKLCKSLKKIVEFGSNSSDEKHLKIFSIFLVMFLLFSSGFVAEVITKGDDYSPNIVISKPRAPDIDGAQYIFSHRRYFFSDHEVFSAKWLAQNRNGSMKIYLDCYTNTLLTNPIGPQVLSESYVLMRNETKVKKGYMFLNTYNIVKGVSIVQISPPKMENVSEVYPINTSSRIYNNGGSEIYHR